MKFNVRFFKKLPACEKQITVPTVFTILRLILTPFIVGAMVTQHWGIAFFLFLSAALTDSIDGNLARLCKQKTFLGACLDPVADKFLLLSCFFTLAFVQSPLFAIPLWFVFLILFKELIVIFGSLIILVTKGYLEVKPTLLGKMTTVAQICFILWLFACYFCHWLPIKTYYTMLGMLLILTFLSLFQYIRIGMRYIVG